MNQVEHTDCKDQDERTEKQTDVQVQIAGEEIKASHQKRLMRQLSAYSDPAKVAGESTTIRPGACPESPIAESLGMPYTFLADTYETECLKVVSVWSEFEDDDLEVRPRVGDVRGRSVREQMVHQCVSEDAWFRNMLGIDVAAPPLPREETRLAFITRVLRRCRQASGRPATPD